MLKSILIGLDGSPYSESAVTLAIKWAKHFDSLLVGIGVIDEPTIAGPTASPVGSGYLKREVDESRIADATRQVEQFLSGFVETCTAASVSHKLLEITGDPSDVILDVAKRYDLILLGQRTYFHFESQDGPGDTLKSILKNTPRPVVTAPEKYEPGSTMVIAYDGSLQATRSLQLFLGSGLAGLHPIHVLSLNKDEVQAARDANQAVEFLSFHNLSATPHAIKCSNASGEVLLAEAEQLDADLVVMGAYGQSAITDFFLGSSTQSILKRARLPLFLYH